MMHRMLSKGGFMTLFFRAFESILDYFSKIVPWYTDLNVFKGMKTLLKISSEHTVALIVSHGSIDIRGFSHKKYS